MSKQKYYVVWRGLKPGIYTSWEECKKQVTGFENARYKSFLSEEEAKKAFSDNPWKYIKRKDKAASKSIPIGDYDINSLAVDAACSGNPGKMEYRGVVVSDGKELFHIGPLDDGTNNIGEFLAIVHGLALLKQQNSNLLIYSDSVNAIKWVNNKKCNTKLKQSNRNQVIFEMIERAEQWLKENTFNTPILKWETEQWGEIPADFGRK